MADVKWIRIATDIFNNEKIRLIESMPEGDTIIVIWFKLLALAGTVNDNGNVYFTKEIPYTDQMLSTVFNRPLTTIQLAIDTFIRFGMVEIVNDIIYISNWEKYQNIEGLEKIREQTRARVAKHRETKKLECNVTSNVTVTQGNATDIDIEEDIDKEKEKKNKEKNIRHKHGEYGHVLLTDDQYKKLCDDYGKDATEKAIKKVDEYCQQYGKSYKDYNLTLRKWGFDGINNKSGKKTSPHQNNISAMNKLIDELVAKGE